jgi:hypothetical protein
MEPGVFPGGAFAQLTSRLLAQASERRLLIVIGDGLISDEGYEGRYAWADAAHAVEEADDAAVSIYYIGVGQTKVDPLPDVFGPRRSTRIKRVEELPRVLAHVHRELRGPFVDPRLERAQDDFPIGRVSGLMVRPAAQSAMSMASVARPAKRARF